ncbi:FACT complex subunit SSRP1, partial [Tanacetum coccineum]
NMLSFLVGQKQAFEVSIADVSQTQLQGKNDVILEFHVDDKTGEMRSVIYWVNGI